MWIIAYPRIFSGINSPLAFIRRRTDWAASDIRRREFERFITELEKLPETVSEFDDTLWGSLVDYVTVGKDRMMMFTLIGRAEMQV